MNARLTVTQCGFCHAPMPAVTRRAIYCSSTCRSRAHRARKRSERSVSAAGRDAFHSGTRTQRKSPCGVAPASMESGSKPICTYMGADDSVPFAGHTSRNGGTRTPRNARCDVESVLVGVDRCLGCATKLGAVRYGTRCCSNRCRKRIYRWRKDGLWPRARLLADAWGIRPRDLWRTPPELFAQLDQVFHFGLDCASAGDDALCGRWITPEEDALTVSWRDRCPDGMSAFVNPPYSRLGGGLLRWVEKAIEERDAGLPVVMLIPPDPSTQYHKLVRRHAVEERCTPTRLAFLHPDTGVPTPGNRGASMVVPFLPGVSGPATATFLDDPWSPHVSSYFA